MRRAMRNPLLGAHDARLGTSWKLGGMSRSLDDTVLHPKPVAGTGGLHEAEWYLMVMVMVM